MTPDAYKRSLNANRGAVPAVTGGADFDFASAVSHDHVLRSPFAPAPTFASVDDADMDMRFEQEFAETEMAQYLSFDSFDAYPSSSSPLSAHNNNSNDSNNALLASPPPSSDADGASPALSFVGSDGGFGFGSPSPGSWSAHQLPLGEANASVSPRSPPLYSPTHDFPQLSPGPSGLGLGISGGEGGSLFVSTGYEYGFALDPFTFNPCATGDTSSGFGFSNAPWDNLDLLGAQAQSPKLEFDASAAQGSQQQQQQQPQLFLPQASEAMDAPRRSDRYAPYTSPAISPRELELPAPASAPGLSTPSWAAQLWDAPTSSTLSGSSMHHGMLAEHGRSASEASVFTNAHQMHPGAFVPPPSAPAAIPIPTSANSNNGATVEFQAYNHSTPALAQMFQQPASAPVQAPAGFMPPSPFRMSNVPLDNGSALGTPSAAVTRGDGQGHNVSTGSGFRARMRSYSHRVVPSWLDRQRAPFSTRASAGFAQGEAQAIEREVKMKAEDEAATWSSGIGLGLGMSVGGAGEGAERDKKADMSTVRVAWPSSVPTNASTTSLLGLNEADPDATVRRKKRTSSSAQTPSPAARNALLARAHSREPSSEKDSTAVTPSKEGTQTALRSELRPPKLAPSTWQLYFTDWIQRHQMLGGADRKLNVAQAAKEAGAEYASLSAEQKEPYKRRSQAAKEARERELAAWQRTLTPDDIKKENAYRAQQRRAGKSRKGNIKDPNAPKKPLSAYFMFLQHIRADPERVRWVFGDEKETTNQSVLAAQTWRAMSDEERKPFLAQAEKEKLNYEAARRMYEEGTVGFETTISFGDNNAGSSSSSTFSAYPTMGMGTTFVIGRPPHEVGSGSDSDQDPEVEGESEDFGTDEERRSPRRH